MKLGAERNKVIALGVLSVVAAYSIYTNLLSGPDLPPEARQATNTVPKKTTAVAPLAEPPLSQPPPVRTPASTQRRQAGRSLGQFVPSLAVDPKNRPDPMTVDPTLRLDLIAKLQNITLEGGHRSLFDFSAAPLSPTPAPKVEVGPVKPPAPKKGFLPRAMGPETKPPDPPKPVEPPKPPPPPIPLKFYGFSAPRSGAKRAFFLEGDEIFVAGEGELIKRRYKVVRIGVNSVLVEDTEYKHQQSLPLEEPTQG
ncbi:MAG: hypothetical protein NZV14_14790 [Bryobacteraceae bacterium]|nr:hypothetical protein [Bryobacteraceae bacterium]MDW8379430.1 hypothetical protein [Bryobacterales bacterium]